MNNDWQTPKWLYDELDAEFNFDFDPCPLDPDFDGLQCAWGQRNFVNPPYSTKLKTEFVKLAVGWMQLDRLSVVLLPVSTSTALYHDIIKPHATEIRFLRGRVKFHSPGAKKDNATFDSMIVVFRGISLLADDDRSNQTTTKPNENGENR